jgi:hypothetical protein
MVWVETLLQFAETIVNGWVEVEPERVRVEFHLALQVVPEVGAVHKEAIPGVCQDGPVACTIAPQGVFDGAGAVLACRCWRAARIKEWASSPGQQPVSGDLGERAIFSESASYDDKNGSVDPFSAQDGAHNVIRIMRGED